MTPPLFVLSLYVVYQYPSLLEGEGGLVAQSSLDLSPLSGTVQQFQLIFCCGRHQSPSNIHQLTTNTENKTQQNVKVPDQR